MRAALLGLLMITPAYAGVRLQAHEDVLDPAIISPTHINALPAAVEVTPTVGGGLVGGRRKAGAGPVDGRRTAVSATVTVTATTAVSASRPLRREMVSQQECLAGIRVIAQLAIVGYDAHPNKAFMKVAANAAVIEPGIQQGVPPVLKGLNNAVTDLPPGASSVKEIDQAMALIITACAAVMR
jgi:hypothetical protein